MLLVFPQILLEDGESPLKLGLDVILLSKLFPEPGELDLVMSRGGGVRVGGRGVQRGGKGHGDQGGGNDGNLHDDDDVRP